MVTSLEKVLERYPGDLSHIGYAAMQQINRKRTKREIPKLLRGCGIP
jgi:hypothetical protein